MSERRKANKTIRIKQRTENLLNTMRPKKDDSKQPTFDDVIIRLWNDRTNALNKLKQIKQMIDNESGPNRQSAEEKKN